jgi:4-diphosphocytidyl-2-C-methyl-D-erythritol kinase
MNNRKELQFQTPAKINFFLFIQNKRPDGYHDLLMDLIPVSLYDSITIRKKKDRGIDLKSNLPGVPVEDNLVYKAIKLLEEHVGKRFALTIDLLKRIPSGAGLGGGSGNAAGVLVVLNQWYQLGLSITELKEIALNLGADVPFFVNPEPSLAQGIGEKLTSLPFFKPLSLLLLYPGFSIATGFAYSICHISARKKPIGGYSLSELQELGPEINDFWPSLKEKHPTLETCRKTLLSHGAEFCGLSGSGSTLYGVFADKSNRDRAFSKLDNHPQWQLFPCETLPKHPYFRY